MTPRAIFTIKQFSMRNTMLLNALYNLDIGIRKQDMGPKEECRFAEPTTGSLYFADVLTLHMYQKHANEIVAAIKGPDGVVLRHLVTKGVPVSPDSVKTGLMRMRKELMQELLARQTRRKETARSYSRKGKKTLHRVKK